MKTKTTTAKKSPARKPRVSPAAPKTAQFLPLEFHVHPHLIQAHDADSITGEKLPVFLVTSPRPDAAEILARIGAELMTQRGPYVRTFDAAGKETTHE